MNHNTSPLHRGSPCTHRRSKPSARRIIRLPQGAPGSLPRWRHSPSHRRGSLRRCHRTASRGRSAHPRCRPAWARVRCRRWPRSVHRPAVPSSRRLAGVAERIEVTCLSEPGRAHAVAHPSSSRPCCGTRLARLSSRRRSRLSVPYRSLCRIDPRRLLL